MALNFLRKSLARPKPQPGDRIYAVGDIHGRHDLLLKLIGKIDAHQCNLPRVRATYVLCLGDIVDRGPDSAQVISFLLKHEKRGGNVVTLLGNHEDMMLRALKGEPGMMRAWLRIGGKATLESYGIAMDKDMSDMALMDEARQRVPAEHLEWLGRLPLSTRSGDYFFCHAGIKPGNALKRQSRSDMLWIRDEFLKDDRMHECVIVHGHSVEEEVQLRPNRIGIDTGAYRTGTLTALYLEGGEREFLSATETDLDSRAPMRAIMELSADQQETAIR